MSIMRQSLFITGLIAVIVCMGSLYADSYARATVDKKANEEKSIPSTKENASKIISHRAIYSLAMGAIKNGGRVSDVSGNMMYEIREVCDGWAMQQHTQVNFSYTDNDSIEISSTNLSWEAKDGSRYTFNTQKSSNGQGTEAFRGNAFRDKDGSVKVTYTIPKDKKNQLPAGTLFPAAHTAHVLSEAAKGEQFFSNTVFDGTDENGYDDISAFVSAKKSPETTDEKDKGIASGDFWPVHFAFFRESDETGSPEYEMDVKLLPNGITNYINTDYGDFTVIAKLQEVEALPAPKCK